MSRANPYKLFDYYGYEDRDIYFGREAEVRRMAGEILSTRLLVLFAPSGSGKSSLINAGVRPLLEEQGYHTMYLRLEEDPRQAALGQLRERFGLPAEIQDLHKALVHLFPAHDGKAPPKSDKEAGEQAESVPAEKSRPLVIFFDQFEEFFVLFRDQPVFRREFVEELASIVFDRSHKVYFVISLRSDYFVSLNEFRDAIPSVFQNNANIELKPFDDDSARIAIVKPAAASGGSYQPALVDRLIADLKHLNPNNDGVEPITLQIVCHYLWTNLPRSGPQEVTLRSYQEAGSAKKIVQRFLHKALASIPGKYHSLMASVFKLLITPDRTKRMRSFASLKALLKERSDKKLRTLLALLCNAALVREEKMGGEQYFELRHDYLAKQLSIWLKARDDKRLKRRHRAQLTTAIVIPILLLSAWLFVEYHQWVAKLTRIEFEDDGYHVVLARKWNPLKEEVQTGISVSQLDPQRGSALFGSMELPWGDPNNWAPLLDILEDDERQKISSLIDGDKEGGATPAPEAAPLEANDEIEESSLHGTSSLVLVSRRFEKGREDEGVEALVALSRRVSDLSGFVGANYEDWYSGPGKMLEKEPAKLVALLQDPAMSVERKHFMAHWLRCNASIFSDEVWLRILDAADVMLALPKEKTPGFSSLLDYLFDPAVAQFPRAKEAALQKLGAAFGAEQDVTRRAHLASRMMGFGVESASQVRALIDACKEEDAKNESERNEVIYGMTCSALDKLSPTSDAETVNLLWEWHGSAPREDLKSHAALALLRLGRADEPLMADFLRMVAEADFESQANLLKVIRLNKKAGEEINKAVVAGKIQRRDLRWAWTLLIEGGVFEKPQFDLLLAQVEAARKAGLASNEAEDGDSIGFSVAMGILTLLHKNSPGQYPIHETLALMFAKEHAQADKLSLLDALAKVAPNDPLIHKTVASLLAAAKEDELVLTGLGSDWCEEGTLSEELARAIEKRLAHLEEEERLAAAQLLVHSKTLSPTMLEGLIRQCLDDELSMDSDYEDIFDELAEAHASRFSTDQLLEWLQDERCSHRCLAEHLFSRQEGFPEKVRTALENLRGDKRPWVRMAAAKVLLHKQDKASGPPGLPPLPMFGDTDTRIYFDEATEAAKGLAIRLPGTRSLVVSPYDKFARLIDVSKHKPGDKMNCPFSNLPFVVP